jgi:hypothetical protein
MRFPIGPLLCLLTACSSEDVRAPAPSQASGCVVGSIEEYCQIEPRACDLSTLPEAEKVQRFFQCEGFDAGACCAPDDAPCRANRVEEMSCECVRPSDSSRITLVRFSTVFGGNAFYFDGSGELVATVEWVDTNAFCHHTSPEGWYGAVMNCRCVAESELSDAG